MRICQLAVCGLLAATLSTALYPAEPAKPANTDPPQVSIEPRARPGEKEVPAPKANIRVDTTVVQIPVTVTDQLNRFVTGLDKENFRVFEDKAEQKVSYFSSEDAPLSVGIVFDTSGSMGRNSINRDRPFRSSSRPPIRRTSFSS